MTYKRGKQIGNKMMKIGSAVSGKIDEKPKPKGTSPKQKAGQTASKAQKTASKSKSKKKDKNKNGSYLY